MTIPVKKKTHSKTHHGRSHEALKGTTLSVCPKCKSKILPHHACGTCGEYKKKTVLRSQVEKKAGQKAKKEKKEKEASKKNK